MLKKMLSSAAKASTRVGASVSGKLNTAKHLMHNQTNSMLNKIMHSSQTFKMNTKSFHTDPCIRVPSRILLKKRFPVTALPRYPVPSPVAVQRSPGTHSPTHPGTSIHGFSRCPHKGPY